MQSNFIELLKALALFFFPEAQARQQQSAVRDFVAEVFQPGNIIRRAKTAEVFEVLEVDCGSAWLASPTSSTRVEWVLGCGKLRPSVQRQWVLVAPGVK